MPWHRVMAERLENKFCPFWRPPGVISEWSPESDRGLLELVRGRLAHGMGISGAARDCPHSRAGSRAVHARPYRAPHGQRIRIAR